LPHEGYELKLDDVYPKTYDYYGYTFTIEDVRVLNDELMITHTIENEDEFSASTLDFEDYEQNHSGQSSAIGDDGVTTNEYYSYCENVGDNQSFHFTLSQPKITVFEPGEFKVDLSKTE
jgi:hypothetical protein